MEAVDANDAAKFAKLHVSSITQLALIAPYKFEDRRIYATVQEGKEQVVDATVERIERTPKALFLHLYVHNFSHALDAVFFYPKPYMSRMFQTGERYYLYGKITCKAGKCQIAHPQKSTHIGTLVAKYKTPLRSDSVAKLIERYVTQSALEAEGLPAQIAKELIAVHKDGANDSHYALKFAELYDYMRALRRKRRYFPAKARLQGEIEEWIASLPFTLTDAQKAAIADIRADLRKETAAKRMIVGDVGSGKTMVILASVLTAQPFKTVLMAPTTILAKQLFEEAQKYLPRLSVGLVTNATKSVLLDEYDFIVGTHALLYRELPKEVALVMIDEQHRFGTAQRHKLDTLFRDESKRPHMLQFSATPIPRTQAMIDAAHIDVSLITQTPFRRDITSKVIGKTDFKMLLAHIKKEIAQKRQVLIIYPLVERSEAIDYQSIEEARGYWEKHFENVFVTHGKDKEKEAILEAFRDNGDILLATTVVEVGISLPRLSSVVIVGAERLGLSTLHQLRGRVSRNGLKGYCFLYTHAQKNERLARFVETTNGFDIAALDLQYRQSGDLLKGEMQSGKKFRYIDIGEDEKIVRDVKKHLENS